MIWNGWTLALIVGQLMIVAVNAAAFFNAVKIVQQWDISSFSPGQLELERRTELIATVVSWSLFFQLFSLLVFEITARSLAPFIPGAMCTVGTLEAHWLGWPVLFVKVAVIYLYGFWIVMNHVDMQVEGFPLTRLKSWLLIALFPIMTIDLLMQIAYFTGLDPSVMSSCCGVIFEAGGEGFGASVASLPPNSAKSAMGAMLTALIVTSFFLKKETISMGRFLYGLGSLAGLVLGIAGIVAFVAPYIYMMPALHCPFIFLDQEHYNYGYLVYIPLFSASLLGMSAGFMPIIERRFPSTAQTTRRVGTGLIRSSRLLWLVFLVAAYGPMVKFWIETGGNVDLFQVGY